MNARPRSPSAEGQRQHTAAETLNGAADEHDADVRGYGRDHQADGQGSHDVDDGTGQDNAEAPRRRPATATTTPLSRRIRQWRLRPAGRLVGLISRTQRTLRRVAAEGWSHAILDGEVVDADRCAEKTLNTHGEVIDAWSAGKTHHFGGNVQAVMRPDGLPICVCDVLLGSIHDLTAARERVSGNWRALYWAASRLDLPTLADPGYQGADIGVRTPIKHPADGRFWTPTTAATTPCCAACAAWANVGSRC
jgi:hypothetical protein